MPAIHVSNTYIHIPTICRGLFFNFHFENTFFNLNYLLYISFTAVAKEQADSTAHWVNNQARRYKSELEQFYFFLKNRSVNLTFSYLQNELWLWKTYPVFSRLFWIQRNKKNVLSQRKVAFCHFGKGLIIQYPLFCSKQTWQTLTGLPSGKLIVAGASQHLLFYSIYSRSLEEHCWDLGHAKLMWFPKTDISSQESMSFLKKGW